MNVQVMARTRSIYDHFDIYLTPVTLTFNLPKKCFKWHFASSRATTVPNCFESHALLYIIVMVQTNPDGHADARTYTDQKM